MLDGPGARVVMLNLPSPRARAARKRIAKEARAAASSSGAEELVTAIDCDLADFKSVRRAAGALTMSPVYVFSRLT